MSLITEFLDGRLPPDLYDQYLTSLFEPWSKELIARSPPRGDVLDVACGTGIVSRALSAQAAVNHVTAIDIAEPMIAKARALTDPTAPVSFQAASADALPFQDHQFTAAFCQQALQFFPDKVAALKEIARVVEPGGTLTLAVWTSTPNGNPVYAAFEDIVAEDLGEDLVPFGPFSFGDAQALSQVATDAGLQIETLDHASLDTALPDPRTLVLFDLMFLGRPGSDGNLQPLFDPADASQDAAIEALIEKFETAVGQYQQADGTLLAPSAANVLIATVPA